MSAPDRAGGSEAADSRARSFEDLASYADTRTASGYALRIWWLDRSYLWAAIPFLTREAAEQAAFELVDPDTQSYSIRPAQIRLEVTTS